MCLSNISGMHRAGVHTATVTTTSYFLHLQSNCLTEVLKPVITQHSSSTIASNTKSNLTVWLSAHYLHGLRNPKLSCGWCLNSATRVQPKVTLTLSQTYSTTWVTSHWCKTIHDYWTSRKPAHRLLARLSRFWQPRHRDCPTKHSGIGKEHTFYRINRSSLADQIRPGNIQITTYALRAPSFGLNSDSPNHQIIPIGTNQPSHIT